MKNASKIVPNKGKGPVTVIGVIGQNTDLGATAKVVNSANTPHRSKSPPGLSLILFAGLDKDSAKVASKALGNVKGVNAKASKVNVKKGEINITLSGTAKVTIGDIVGALKDAGVEAQLNKT